MEYQLENRILNDRANHLPEILRAFGDSRAPVWHVDRPVLSASEAHDADVQLRYEACLAGLALLRYWTFERDSLVSSGALISRPYLTIDDSWLSSDLNATPPHVYVCLANSAATFQPVQHPEAQDVSSNSLARFKSLLLADERVRRVTGVFDSDPGAWLIDIYAPE